MPFLSFSTDEILRFLIVLFRVSGIVVFAPFFGSASIPYQIRIAFTLITSIVLVPALPMDAVPAGFGLADLTLVIVGEVMLGMVLGLAANLVFAGIQYAGQMISLQMGFSLIKLIDPQTDVEAPVFSFIHNYIGLLLFLLLNGHHWFLLAVNESFHILPAGGFHLNASLTDAIVRISAQIFVIGLRIAGPVVAVTIVADIVIGIIGRVAPQIHILIVGLPLKLLVGFSCLCVSFYFIPQYLETVFSSLYRDLFSLVRTMV
jgi:flagellar biosynthetic protein FliR